ncbi:TM0106 family RecB-like putative nuclease [Pseudonocardia yuanmonensis]|uniref:TM0106 family RecB-like putative nuclease n=1 Tax=Pseudonocardia yuanmonensis TaxID=1095914 RepID=A0ABP8WHU5_9PSEU
MTATISGAGGQAGPGGPVPGRGEGSTPTVHGTPSANGHTVPLLDAAATTRCRRRVHLDHDPSAASAPRALPDPALEQRRADVREHRARVAETVAGGQAAAWRAVPEGLPAAERARLTGELVAGGAGVIGGAVLPVDPAGRRGSAELLVRVPGGGYVPVIVVRHRITDPGAGAATTLLTSPFPQLAVVDEERKVRSQPRDLLRLAHLTRMLQTVGWAPAAEVEGADRGGVVGLDADVVVWHDLRAGHWPGDRSTLEEYDERFADRAAVALAAATGAEPLAEPSRVLECRRCPWWPTCEARLTAERDVSLVVRGDTAVALREVGVRTVDALADLDPLAEPPVPLPGTPFPDVVALARGWRRGLAVARRVERVPVYRADVEVDVDMESFGESGAYLWGAALSYPGGAREGDEPEGYRAFATWEPVPTPDEGRSFAEFWTWLSGVRAAAERTGRTFAAYCYNEQAENRWLLSSATRFAGMPGVPPVEEVREFIAADWWVDLFAVVNEWFLCAQGKGLKKIAPVAGFRWRDPEAGGENSMRWYRDAVGMDGAPPDPAQRERLLGYNTDDVLATQALREWMTSRAIDEVPLASEL